MKGQYDTLPERVRCVFRRNPGSLTIDLPPSETTRWRAVARVLRSPLSTISDAISGVIFSTIYPTSCSLCDTPLSQFSYAPICHVCWAEIAADNARVSGCVRCGDVVDNEGHVPGQVSGQAHCRACSLVKPAFEKAVFYGLYRERMRQAIHALKYERLTPAARGLGSMLAAAIEELYGTAPAEMLVVPVPLHKRRAAHRGFNQTRLLARHALAELRRRRPDWKLTLAPRTLARTRNTESQAGLSSRQRRRNLRGAFRVTAPEAVSGRHVLVVDDILTTGATARAAAQALKAAGAETVWVATLARARREASNLRTYPQEANPLTGASVLHDEAEPIRTAATFLSSTSSTT
jgi:ComF family protein